MKPKAAVSRRDFFTAALGAAAVTGAGLMGRDAPPAARKLDGEIGITTGTFSRQLAPGSKLTPFDLPKLVRDELGLRVIDLMTATVPSLEPEYLERLRAAAERAGCVFTNLKLNQPGLDLSSPDETTRRHAINFYQKTMTAAAHLGVRWVRPIPGVKAANSARLPASFRELIDHGAPLGISLLIENVGWIKDQPEAIPSLIAATGQGLHAQPDIGNWADAVRYEGLAKAFPLAASCDFKAWELGEDGSHARYDLQRCFQIGWDAGFRGPWCIEHFNDSLKGLLADLSILRDHLRAWMNPRN